MDTEVDLRKILDNLKSQDLEERRLAFALIDAKGKLFVPLIVERLTTSAEDRDREILASILSSIQRNDPIQNREIIPTLLEILKRETSPFVQQDIILLLGDMKALEAHDHLVTLLNDEYHQEDVIVALGNIGHPDTFEFLIPFLNHEDWEIQVAAIHSLGNLRDTKAVDYLKPYLSEAEIQCGISIAQVTDWALKKIDTSEAKKVLKEYRDLVD